MIGPAVAGVLVARLGEGWCFFANGVSYIAVIIGLLLMNVHSPARAFGASPLDHVKEGFRFVNATAPIRALLMLLGLVSATGMPYVVLMPIFADRILHKGGQELATLIGSHDLGAVRLGILMGAAGVMLADLGEHRLRDLSRAERVFQLCGAGLESEFPALASLDAFPGNLPLQVSEFIGRATNNVAEYSGLLAGLRAAGRLAPGAEAEVRMDSKLVVEQMSGRWRIKHPELRVLAAQASQAARALGRVSYTWVPRERNSHADRLANEAMDALAKRGTGNGDRPSRDALRDGSS